MILIISDNSFFTIYPPMAQQQKFIDAFAQVDTDKDGEINRDEFIQLINKLQAQQQYQGTVTKIFRKLNYKNPQKETINSQQAKEYYQVLQNTPKYQIWSKKLSLESMAYEMKKGIYNIKEEDSGAAPSAAPGGNQLVVEPEHHPQQAHIKVLVGPSLPTYSSQVDIQIQKTDTSQKAKPFIKVTFSSSSIQRAQKLESLFKQTLNTFINILCEQQPDWQQEIKRIHINSFVNNTKTTFLFTTKTEQLVELIHVFSEFLQLSFHLKATGKLRFKYEFNYDFQKFITQENSTFYDIWTKNCKLSLDAKVLNILKSIRKLIKFDFELNKPYMDMQQLLMISLLLHLEEVDADLEFQNSQITQCQLESKEQLKGVFRELGEYFKKLTEAGLKIGQLLELLDETIAIQVNAGEWKGVVQVRLKNINKLILNFLQKAMIQQPQPTYQESILSPESDQVHLGLIKNSSLKSLKKKPSFSSSKKSNSDHSDID